VQNTQAGTALAVSKVLPYTVAAVLAAWTVSYGRYQKRKGERLAAAAAARAGAEEVPAEARHNEPARPEPP
jgi:hypothetical protein